jgi:hypothetical protein
MICTYNVPDPSDKTAAPDESIPCGPLIFDPLPPIAADEDVTLAAADDQAELMQWGYLLGHLSFQKLKQLALNGKIPKKLLKLKLPNIRNPDSANCNHQISTLMVEKTIATV